MCKTDALLAQVPRLVLFLLLLVGTPSVFCQQPSPTPTPSPAPARTGKSYGSAVPANRPPASAPEGRSPVTFTDIANSINIKFKRASSLTSMKYLLEAMGSGVAMFDYDNDGRLDLFFANSAELKDLMPKRQIPEKQGPQFWNRLYHQKEDGTFEDVTERSGLKGIGYSIGAAAADYDNDGYVDLYVTGYANNFLYHNNGDGTFTDVTKRTGVGGGGWSTSAAWLDFDRDGRLDLFVGRYLEWDFDIGAVYCGELRAGYRAYCHPDNFKSTTTILYRQIPDGSFQDVSDKSGIQTEGAKALGVALGDFDNDGFIDIFVANDSIRQSLYRNKGDGTFEDIALSSGAGYDENGKTYAGMGVDAGDYDNDGYLDILITTLSNETYALYRNDRDLNFTYTTNSAGVGQITILYSGWGTRFIDVNNDGMRDIFVAQSHVLDTIEKTHPYLKYKQHPLLMLNTGKIFVNVSATAGPAFLTSFIGRGAAFGDLNNDGQIDVVMSTLDGPPVVLLNNGTKNHWLGLSLVGSRSNRSGIGARVTVTDSGGKKQIVDANTSASYLSSNDPRILLGLGSASAVRTVEIKWPSGTVQTISQPQLDRYVVVTEPNPK